MNFKPNLIQYLPQFMDKDKINKILESIAEEMGIVAYSVYDTENQIISVDTATHSLSKYEDEYGIISDTNLSYERRRNIIKSKMRGNSTTTIDLIQSIAQAFSQDKVEIQEVNSEYYFIIKFISKDEYLNDLSAIINILEPIKPAHLGYVFERELNNILKFTTKCITNDIIYPLCGTYNCGVYPIITTDGIELSSNIGISVQTQYIDAQHNYPMTNESTITKEE